MMHTSNNVKVKAEGVTDMCLVSDLLCERGYCRASCQWLAMWERLLPCVLSVTCYVREVTAMPLVSDLLYERGYCLASCQWLAMCERLLPCVLSLTWYVRGITAMSLVSDCYVREVTAMPCQWLAICQRCYFHTSCQGLTVWKRLLPCLLPAKLYVKHAGILRQSDHYNQWGGCLVLRLVWILMWHASSASQLCEYSASILLVGNEI